jgi:hypothetical protein
MVFSKNSHKWPKHKFVSTLSGSSPHPGKVDASSLKNILVAPVPKGHHQAILYYNRSDVKLANVLFPC